MRVALDAGHGYKRNMPTGARANGVVEDNLTLKIANKVRWYLLNQYHGAVTMTRPGREFVELKQRPKTAKQAKCDLFLSLHVNAAGAPEAQGVEAYCTHGDTRSAVLAEDLVNALSTHNGLRRRGVRWDDQSQHSSLYVLRNTYSRMLAVLLEVGFLTSPHDSDLMKEPAWVEGVSARIAMVVAEYLKK